MQNHRNEPKLKRACRRPRDLRHVELTKRTQAQACMQTAPRSSARGIDETNPRPSVHGDGLRAPRSTPDSGLESVVTTDSETAPGQEGLVFRSQRRNPSKSGTEKPTFND